MNHALSFSPPTSTAFEVNFIRAVRALPSATLPCFVAAVVLSTVAIANVPTAGWWRDELPADLPAVVAPVRESGKAARLRAVCESCGVVETVRRFEPVGEQPAGYELTVRLRDGSARVSSVDGSAKWLAGDRIMLIGGAPAPAKSLP